MPIIEGIGDEVVQFFACVSVVLLATAAWISTNVREVNSYRVCITSFAHWLRMRRLEETMGRRTSLAATNTSIEHNGDSSEMDNNTNGGEKSNTGTASNTTTHQNINLQSEPIHDQSQLDYTRGDITEQGSPRSSRNGVVNIKLKYLNESIKIADGNLNETLGDFKRRHFSTELSQGKKVIMLFNGSILGRDEQTLRAYGIFDDCVVHCMFRQPTAANTLPRRRSRPRRNRGEADLFMFVCTSWGVVLVGMWFSRYRFAEWFSATATAGLMMMTGLYLACLVGACLPEEEVGLAPVQ